MVIENDINKINAFADGRVIEKVERNQYGLLFTFEDGSKMQINTFQYQVLISE